MPGMNIALLGSDARMAEIVAAAIRRHDRVVAGVDEDREPVGDQLFRGFERAHRIGQERAAIAEHLEFYPLRR
jgi:hypothetical protein